MTDKIADNAQHYLETIGLLGLVRITLFESFGDRKYWNERYFDLFMSLLVKQLRGLPVTLEDLTASITGVSHSTKIRLIEEARKDGLIISVNRSKAEISGTLENAGARKVFYLSDGAVDSILNKLDTIGSDVEGFVARRQAS